MKRLAIIMIVLLVAAFVAISVRKSERNGGGGIDTTQSELSMERKAEIRRFWDAQRRATTLMRQGSWEEAASAYREALAIDPHHEDALYYLGNVLFELEQYDEAVASWRRLIEVNPLSTRAHIQLGSVYSCGAEGTPFDLDVAEREFERALAINKEQIGPILKLGEVCLLGGRVDEALEYFETALKTNAKSTEAHFLIGYLMWRRGDGDEGLAALRRAVESSQVKRPVAQPAGEGETRTAGGGPILAEGASRRSLFAPHWMVLKTWDLAEVSEIRMNDEYEALDDRLRFTVGDARVR